MADPDQALIASLAQSLVQQDAGLQRIFRTPDIANGARLAEAALAGAHVRRGRVRELLAAHLRPDAGFPASAPDVVKLSPEALTRARETALDMTLQFNLPADRAAVLADALVGSLALS